MTPSRDDSTLLRVENLGIHIEEPAGPREIVRDVSFSIVAGEAMALVGESGAGKSITARAIARLLPEKARMSGRIVFDGVSVADLSGEELRAYRTGGVGVVAQDPRAAINPVRRVGDFLTEALVANLGESPAEAGKTVSRLLIEAGISDPERRMRQYPYELSGGLLQRVMIASVVAMQPKLILADEPTTALDVTTQSEVMAILDEMRDRYGMALLLITHDLELASAVCGRTAVMYAGTLVEHQASANMFEDPLHPYTAGLAVSRPGLGPRPARLPVITGRPQAASEVGDGCPFAPRCSYALDRCRAERPSLRDFGPGMTACLRAEDLEGQMWPTASAGTVSTDV